MKKDCKSRDLWLPGIRLRMKKILLVMKLSVFILLFSIASVSASVYSQSSKLNINVKNTSINDILVAIENQSEFRFAFSSEYIDLDRKVSVNFEDQSLEKILENIFEDTDIGYTIKGRHIILQNEKQGINEQQVKKTVKGKVTDEEGESLPGVTVVEKGTTTGTVTDFEGNYSLVVSGDDVVLSFSFIGFATQDIAIAGNTLIDVSMTEEVTGIDEVVVVGFGSQRKENITGATSFVKMDDIIADRPIVNSAQALQGVSAGLQVVSTSGQPGATNTSLNIRGIESINGGSPLVLVNNVPMSLNDVNPRDIESVSVLKDAAASSIYGARAAFGVILITTKTAKKNQPMKFEYSTTTSLSSPMELPEKATTREFVEALNDFGAYEYFAGQNVEKWLGLLDQYDNDPSQLEFIKDPVSGEQYQIVYDSESGQYYPLADTDIIGDFLNDFGYSTIHNFTMSGGTEKISYRINGGYSYEDGVMVTDKDSYRKYNVNSLLNADLTSNLKSTTNIMYRSSVRSVPTARFADAVQLRMYDPTGFFELSNGEAIPFESPGNVVRYNEPEIKNTDNLRLFQKLEYEPIKDLVITGEYTFEKGFYKDRVLNTQERYASTFKFIENNANPTAQYENTKITREYSDHVYNALNIYAKYKLNIEDHGLNFLAGLNREERINNGFWISKKTLITTDLPAIKTAIGDFDGNDSYGDWAVLGYFGRINYNFKNKYFFEANGRYDGSSRFPEGSQYVFLPSFSAGWNIAKEPFMASVDQISMLKLRASWGEVGNQQTGDLYPSIPGYSAFEPKWINESTGLRYTSLHPAQLVSASFTWEKVRTTNIGIDASFLDNRLSTAIDLFQRETIGMLSQGLQLPEILGTGAPRQNVADLRSRGWELEIKWNDRVGDLRYGINFNLSNYDGEITRFLNEAGLISKYYVGRKIGEIWGYVTDGFYTVDDFVEGTLDAHLSGPYRELKEGVVQIEGAQTPYPGDIKYKDLNGDGVINSGNSTLYTEYDPATGEMIENTGPGDRQVIGNTTRKYQFGINGFAEYKGFDFSFVLSGVGKRDLWLSSDLIWPFPSTFDHIYSHQLDYWTPDNQDAFYPRVYGDPNGNTSSNYGRSRRTQTKYLSDGKYLRIQSVALGYTFSKAITNKLKLNSLRVFAAGNNLHTFDNLPKGMEADQSDNGAYPYMRNFSFGLNLTF